MAMAERNLTKFEPVPLQNNDQLLYY